MKHTRMGRVAAVWVAHAVWLRSEPVPVRAVVVANFEGEYQYWREREHLDEALPVRGAPGALHRNAAGLFGLSLQRQTDLTAFILDSRYDLRKAYWLFTGISGTDPRVATVGCAAWARWVVAGDALREIDDRTVPEGWPYGLWAIGATRPNQLPYDPNHFGSVTDVKELSMAYPLNQGLAEWAYQMTRGIPLADNPVVAARRTAWRGFPQAERTPFVLMGETLGAIRYWHGDERTRWAEDWVRLWTNDKGVFAMTNMESQTHQQVMKVFAAQGLIDPDRIMVLRTASNFSEPPPGVPATATIGDEAPGQDVAFDNNERAGAPVLRELLAHWDRYRDGPP